MAKPEPAATCQTDIRNKTWTCSMLFHVKGAFDLGKLRDFVDGVDLTMKQLHP